MEENNNQYTNGNSEQNGAFYQPPAENNTQQYYQPVNDANMYQAPMMQPEPPKKKGKAGKIIGIIVGVILVAIIAFVAFGMFLDASDSENDDTSSPSVSADASQSEEDKTESSSKKKITYGKIADNAYTNEFAQFGIKLPDENWSFMEKEDLKELLAESGVQSGEDGELYVETDAEKAYYDMMMINNITGTNIQVILSETNIAAGIITSEDMYISNATASAQSSAVTSDSYKLTIAGEEYTAVDLDYTAYGTKQTIAVKKVGRNFVCIILTLYATDSMTSKDYTDMFYSL